MPKFPSANRRQGRIAQWLLAKTWQCLCLCLLKVKGTVENYIKNISGSSPIFALSIHTTFCQTQTGATVRQII
jgi:hypothetical protein